MVFSGVVNSMCVNDLFQYCAVAVHTIPDGFSCRHENVFLFQRQKNGSLTIINLYSLGRNFPLGILLVALSDWSELY